MPGRPASIRDVARRAGVSVGTVSHVLNHPEVVRPNVRERVRRVIEELEYRPNAVARSLRERRTRTIGIVLSDITTPFAATVVRTVERCAAAADLFVVLADTEEDLTREEQTVKALYDKGIDGLILAPTAGDHGFLRRSVERGWPIIVINRAAEGVRLPTVHSDNHGGAAAATQHLLEHGHQRIGVVTRRTTYLSVRARLDGYTSALAAAGVPADPALVAGEDATIEGGITAVRLLLACTPAPTALISLSSVMSLGTVVGLREHGVRIGQDLGLIGFDDADWSAAVGPPMTSVSLRADRVGARATELLLGWITEQVPPAELDHTVETSLVLRQSCGCAPSANAAPEPGMPALAGRYA